MSDAPLFSRPEADRILRRAAELEGTDESRPLSVEELRSIASEAGFGSDAVERALAEVWEDGRRPRRAPVQRWGWLRTHAVAFRQVPVSLDSERLMQAVRLLQPYRDGPAQVKLEADHLTWRDARGLTFSLRSVGGVTEVRVSLVKLVLLRGRWTDRVRDAADRLEALVSLVAEREAAERRASRGDEPPGVAARTPERERPSRPAAGGGRERRALPSTTD